MAHVATSVAVVLAQQAGRVVLRMALDEHDLGSADCPVATLHPTASECMAM